MAPADCRFCAIASGDLDAEVVFADERTIAFLDDRPLFAGHTLLIPREHHVTIEDLPATLVEPVYRRSAQLVSSTTFQSRQRPSA